MWITNYWNEPGSVELTHVVSFMINQITIGCCKLKAINVEMAYRVWLTKNGVINIVSRSTNMVKWEC
jgi:hypothetical protein